MTIAEAKQLRIVDYLASLGYHPQSVTSKQYWYLSPLRNERTPSFKVNDRLNEWYDFGAATGGDLVELRFLSITMTSASFPGSSEPSS